jgi:hypothetical protein
MFRDHLGVELRRDVVADADTRLEAAHIKIEFDPHDLVPRIDHFALQGAALGGAAPAVFTARTKSSHDAAAHPYERV